MDTDNTKRTSLLYWWLYLAIQLVIHAIQGILIALVVFGIKTEHGPRVIAFLIVFGIAGGIGYLLHKYLVGQKKIHIKAIKILAWLNIILWLLLPVLAYVSSVATILVFSKKNAQIYPELKAQKYKVFVIIAYLSILAAFINNGAAGFLLPK